MKILNIDKYIEENNLKLVNEEFVMEIRDTDKIFTIRKEVYNKLEHTHRVIDKNLSIGHVDDMLILETVSDYLNFKLTRKEIYTKEI